MLVKILLEVTANGNEQVYNPVLQLKEVGHKINAVGQNEHFFFLN